MSNYPGPVRHQCGCQCLQPGWAIQSRCEEAERLLQIAQNYDHMRPNEPHWDAYADHYDVVKNPVVAYWQADGEWKPSQRDLASGSRSFTQEEVLRLSELLLHHWKQQLTDPFADFYLSPSQSINLIDATLSSRDTSQRWENLFTRLLCHCHKIMADHRELTAAVKSEIDRARGLGTQILSIYEQTSSETERLRDENDQMKDALRVIAHWNTKWLGPESRLAIDTLNALETQREARETASGVEDVSEDQSASESPQNRSRARWDHEWFKRIMTGP
jgi:hypothetical protein